MATDSLHETLAEQADKLAKGYRAMAERERLSKLWLKTLVDIAGIDPKGTNVHLEKHGTTFKTLNLAEHLLELETSTRPA